MNPLFPEPAGREEKPPFLAIPQNILDKISVLVDDPVVDGLVAYGGFSAAAGYILTLSSGRKVFAKGNHPEEMAHGTENLRQEVFVYQNVPILKTIAPTYIGMVDDGDEDGWMLGLWDYVDAAAPPSLPAMIETMVSWQKSPLPDTLTPARAHNYLQFFLNDDKKWRRIRDEEITQKKFLSIFADKEIAQQWLNKNIENLVALQTKISAIHFAEGLVHGDLRLDNFLFSKEKIYVIDWANACRGPLLFDVLFLFSNLEGLGFGSIETFFDLYKKSGGVDISDDEIVVMLVALSGFFADQAYRRIPDKLPRLRWMQRCMLAILLKTLENLGVVTPIPKILASSN